MSPLVVWRWATYRGRPSFFEQFPLPSDWKPLVTGEGRPGRLWQWLVVNNRGAVVSGGTLVLDVDLDVYEAAYEAMCRFQADRSLAAHELHGLWCAARKATDPKVVGVVDGRDW
ncbi:hypothetical protein ACN27B_08805 [Micromonospora sp. WMMD754]|uniref:hypothetical protein n=1 Tax=Micromonospora sp. WMMD754 TaxID=3404114 RepID=UPI003BF4D0A9